MKNALGRLTDVTVAVLGATLLLANSGIAQRGLQVAYGSQGIQQISWNGVVLENQSAWPADAFHIWHMKMTDLKGNAVTSGQYGWGENNNGRSWDAGSHRWTYPFSWGSITLQYVQAGDTLDMQVTETNLSGSGVILDGAVIYPLALHFPSLPAGFVDPGYAQLAWNTTGPSVTLANFGSGEVAAVVPDAAKPLYSGFQPAGPANSYTTLISGTTPDGLATFQPHNDRPVAPGQTGTFTVSLRFAPSGTALSALASDAYANWAKTWPPQLAWTDRRIIGTVYLASSPQGNVNQPGGYPNNPRRYFSDSSASDFDVRTSAGLARFQAKILQQAQQNVANLRRLKAQGAITWDLEGEQYPQATSYVCSPDQIAQVAPEMESVVSDTTSPYAGMKLDDAYFRTMRDAGFRVGVCIRPQHFAINADGTAQQTYLAATSVEAEIVRKMKYAHDRWGATLFYIDSTVEQDGAVLDSSIFQQAAAALPDSLLIPEESTPKYYACTAPFRTFIFHGDLGTDPAIYNFYPHAFSPTLINDVDPATLAASQASLTQSVKNGDILMVHADYWQANNPTVLQIYADAGAANASTTTPPATPPVSPPTTPVQPPTSSASVTITSPSPSATVEGQLNVTAAIALTLDAAGSYLMADGTEVGTQRFTGPTFSYPLDTGTLTNGQHTLQVWAHDTGNTTHLSVPVVVTVANQASSPAGPAAPVTPIGPTTPVIGTSYPIALTYPLSGQTVTGSLAVSGVITQTLDAAGSFLLVDGSEWGAGRITGPPFLYELDTASLNAGVHTLQLWAHDTNNDTLRSNTISVTVSR